jgi:transposase
MRFDLTDEEWGLLEPLLPTQRKAARVDDRRVMNAIFYVLRTGMPWRDLPERYGLYTTAYNRFNRWSRRGIWKRVPSFPAAAMPARRPIAPSASTAAGTKSRTSSAASRTGDASPPDMTNSPEISSPQTTSSQHSIGSSCESRKQSDLPRCRV